MEAPGEVSVPDTDDGVTPTATERYRKHSSDEEDDEKGKKQSPTPPLVLRGQWTRHSVSGVMHPLFQVTM